MVVISRELHRGHHSDFESGGQARGYTCGCGGVRADAAGAGSGRPAGGSSAVGYEAGDFELFAAVGEIDTGGGEGGASGVYATREPGTVGEPFGPAVHGAIEEGAGDVAA